MTSINLASISNGLDSVDFPNGLNATGLVGKVSTSSIYTTPTNGVAVFNTPSTYNTLTYNSSTGLFTGLGAGWYKFHCHITMTTANQGVIVGNINGTSIETTQGRFLAQGDGNTTVLIVSTPFFMNTNSSTFGVNIVTNNGEAIGVNAGPNNWWSLEKCN